VLPQAATGALEHAGLLSFIATVDSVLSGRVRCTRELARAATGTPYSVRVARTVMVPPGSLLVCDSAARIRRLEEAAQVPRTQRSMTEVQGSPITAVARLFAWTDR
jgi:hypothetical protein